MVLEELGEGEEVEVGLVVVDLLDLPEVLGEVGEDSGQGQVLLSAAQIGHCSWYEACALSQVWNEWSWWFSMFIITIIIIIIIITTTTTTIIIIIIIIIIL